MVIESTSRGAVRRLEMIVAWVLAVRVPGKSRILCFQGSKQDLPVIQKCRVKEREVNNSQVICQRQL